MNRPVTTLDNATIRKFDVRVYLRTLNKHIYIHPHSFYITPNHIRLIKYLAQQKKWPASKKLRNLSID